jgi:hypothetical protein
MLDRHSRSSPVLFYRPTPHTKDDPSKRSWLLWPAWAFRVIAPEPRARTLNALQKAVLGVLQASKLTAQELAKRLCIDPELSAFVAVELQERGFLDVAWGLTPEGASVLKEDAESNAKLVPGWVFRDPWTEDLWPFIASNQMRANTEFDEEGFPRLLLGSKGAPKPRSAWVQFPSTDPLPKKPEAKEIIRAARQQRRLEAQENFSGELNVSQVDIDRISAVESEPEAVFLSTFAYSAEEDWHVCDFFGRGNKEDLKSLMIKVAESTPLALFLDGFLNRSGKDGFKQFVAQTQKNREAAQRVLERVLSLQINEYSVKNPLLDALISWNEMKAEASQRRMRAVLLDCRRSLERLMAWLAKGHPLQGVENRLGEDRTTNQSVIRRALRSVGVEPTPELKPWLNVSQNQVRSAAQYGDSWRLRPLFVAVLLSASRDPSHALREALRLEPSLLHKMESISSFAGEGIHDEREELNLSLVRACLVDTFIVVGRLLGLPVSDLQGVS